LSFTCALGHANVRLDYEKSPPPRLDMDVSLYDNSRRGMLMKNKQDIIPQAVVTRKPPRQKVSDAEFRRRLKRITEWRKQRLADLRAKNTR